MGISGSAESFPRLRSFRTLVSFVLAFVFRRLRAGGLGVTPSSSEPDPSCWDDAVTLLYSSVTASFSIGTLWAGLESLDDLLIVLVVAKWWWLVVEVKSRWRRKRRSELGTARLSHAESRYRDRVERGNISTAVSMFPPSVGYPIIIDEPHTFRTPPILTVRLVEIFNDSSILSSVVLVW